MFSEGRGGELQRTACCSETQKHQGQRHHADCLQTGKM
uniref:Uncharacterized protein n=1 Tax=Anguilla anguilla TaxID=7936 RepID=A0A0E9VC62_ANGAN